MANTLDNAESFFSSLQKAKNKKDTNFVFILKPDQLNILGQVFRPVFSGTIAELTDKYLVIDKVNIKMTNAPEFIFPTALTIPLNQIAVFFEYDSKKRFPLH